MGVVLQPGFLPGFSMSVDWFNIKVKDAIQGIGADTIITQCTAMVKSIVEPAGLEESHFDGALAVSDVYGALLKAIKAKHGLSKIPILFTEGEGIPLYTIDAIGMSPLKGFFEWRLGLLSLDVGPSEVTAAEVVPPVAVREPQVNDLIDWLMLTSS